MFFMSLLMEMGIRLDIKDRRFENKEYFEIEMIKLIGEFNIDKIK